MKENGAERALEQWGSLHSFRQAMDPFRSWPDGQFGAHPEAALGGSRDLQIESFTTSRWNSQKNLGVAAGKGEPLYPAGNQVISGRALAHDGPVLRTD
jgi:hypothetical protein